MDGRSRTSSTAVPATAPRPLFQTRFYLGNRSLRCSTSCIPAVVLHLTAMDGGNAKGLSGTILAMESCVALGCCSWRNSTSSFPGVVPSYV